MLRFLLIATFFLFCSETQALRKPAFSLKEDFKIPLVSLLDTGVYLHKAVYSRKEGQILVALSKMKQQIESLKQRSPQFLPYHQRVYVYRLLEGLQPKLQAFEASTKNRQKKINSINRTLTYLAHTYGLKKYAVFFCPKDRSVWMQGQRKGKPLHLEYASCGTWVGKR